MGLKDSQEKEIFNLTQEREQLASEIREYENALESIIMGIPDNIIDKVNRNMLTAKLKVCIIDKKLEKLKQNGTL